MLDIPKAPIDVLTATETHECDLFRASCCLGTANHHLPPLPPPKLITLWSVRGISPGDLGSTSHPEPPWAAGWQLLVNAASLGMGGREGTGPRVPAWPSLSPFAPSSLSLCASPSELPAPPRGREAVYSPGHCREADKPNQASKMYGCDSEGGDDVI